ncbi:ureidoglycolate lyase [Acuticoccus sp. I52.16.1]|uniref:ureidoglycolate lyase n=1 Tax=Acuticoccus sp. I52.16.1 TaxID=2928472 RepID=UPI001FD595CF|nr:ureidoglycolate lyase [Acuticoccus sp. I52.16.1]UOM34878.1 ureidoglycolate lyase [Acuticoccus sp. I52.16.1]
MNEIIVEPLTAEGFAPFGTVVPPQADPGRTYVDGSLANLRPAAHPSLSMSARLEAASLPLTIRQMERHAFSSQTFVPTEPTSVLVVVAPHAADGGPDMARARAFATEGQTGFTFGADVWHHPLTLLEAPGRFAIFMWLDGTTGDEEFVDIEPMLVTGGTL